MVLIRCQDGIYNRSGNPYSYLHFEHDRIVALLHEPPKDVPVDVDVKQHSGKAILPGMFDSHCHLFMTGEQEGRVNLSALTSPAIVVEKLRQSMQRLGHWSVAYNLQCGLSRVDLDGVSTDRPLVVFSKCLHFCILNSVALEVLLKDEQLGPNPTEHLDEQLGKLNDPLPFRVLKYISSLYTEDEKMEIHKRAMAAFLKNGLCGVQTNDDESSWNYYRQLASTNTLPIRIFLTIPYQAVKISSIPNDTFTDPILMSSLPSSESDSSLPLPNDSVGLLSCARVKIFLDGSLTNKTAALSAPYLDSVNSFGQLLYSTSELVQIFKHLDAVGYRIDMHVIGDGALEQALDALEEAGIDPSMRPCFIHASVTPPALLHRIFQSGGICSIQPLFLNDYDSHILASVPSSVLEHLYVWKSMLQVLGPHRVCAGSDAPVESLNPFLALSKLIYRTELSGYQERLGFDEAFAMYSTASAYAAGEDESDRGLAYWGSGGYADFVVIDRKAWELVHGEDFLSNTQVLEVWVAGRRRFDGVNISEMGDIPSITNKLFLS